MVNEWLKHLSKFGIILGHWPILWEGALLDSKRIDAHGVVGRECEIPRMGSASYQSSSAL